ncbi:MAG: hypothetical protein CFE26_18370, partial [Verrucomicrobiales bacterium VVV1]
VTGQVGTAANGTVTLTAYETWSEVYGGGGVIGSPSDDYDNDGVPNLVEYALGTIPNSSGSMPTVLHEVAGNRLRLKFTPQIVNGLNYTVQSSSDLSEWADMPTSNPPQRFLRLQIAAP